MVPLWLNGTNPAQWISDILIFILVNFVDIATYDSSNAFIQTLFINVPLILNSISFIFNILEIISAITSLLWGVTNVTQWTFLILAGIEALSLNVFLTFAPQILAWTEY